MAHVQKSLPACSSYVEQLAEYVRRNGGGDQGELLEELGLFYKAFAATGPKRQLGGEFIGTVAALNFGPAAPCPYVLLALLETNLLGPLDRDGMRRLLKPNVVRQLANAKTRDDTIKADKIMGDARRVCKTLGSRRTRLSNSWAAWTSASSASCCRRSARRPSSAKPSRR